MAVRLRKLGYAVTIVEALDQAAGRARVFRQDGFTFDAGPTVITAPHLGANPFDVGSIYLLIHWLERKWGVHFGRGGTGAIVAGLVRLLEDIDVTVRLSTPAESIEVSDGRVTGVRTETGELIRAELIVCNADPSFVYTRMLPARERRRNTDRRVARARQSMSLFVGYFGATQQDPSLAHNTIVLRKRYRGLLDDVFHKRVLAADFSLYLRAYPQTEAPDILKEDTGCCFLQALRGSLAGRECYRFLRIIGTSPIRPVASNATDVGSGTVLCADTLTLSRPLLLSDGASPLVNEIVVLAELATNDVVNCCQNSAFVPAPPEFTAVNDVPPFTFSTVLVVPKIPPGLTTFPTQNDTLYVVPVVVAIDC